MDYCGPRGIPWHDFVGWPKVSRDAAILWSQHQAQLCQGCGTHPDDWDLDKGGHRHAYVATVRRCPGCAALAQRTERERKGKGQERQLEPGVHVSLRRQVRRGEGAE